jgi:hypothetical protein
MIEVLAVDLEGTLISNVVSRFPRPRLFEFFEFCQRSSFKTVLFTAVDSQFARSVMMQLERLVSIPVGMGMIPIVDWQKKTGDVHNPKNLQYVQKMFPSTKLHNIYLIDDCEFFVALGQQLQWIQIEHYGTPYSQDDTELLRIMELIRGMQQGV